MKSSLARLVLVFAVLFGAVSVWRWARRGAPTTSGPDDEAQRIRRFWQAYDEATRARTRLDYVRAATLYREALELDPQHEDALFYLAITLEQTGAYREAAEVLGRLTGQNPESARGWSQLGAVLARRSPGAAFDPKAAAQAFRQVEAINPEHSGPFLSLGSLALELGNHEEALDLFRIAADMGSPEGAFRAGLVAHIEGDPGAAASFFRRVLETDARERRIAGRGAASEGDVEANAKLTPLESARIRALCFLYWTYRRAGGYPEDLPQGERVGLAERPSAARKVKARLVLTSDISGKRLDVHGLDYPGTVVDTAAADVDGDGRDDVFVLGWKTGGRLFRNLGTSFEDVTLKAGLEGVGGDGLSAIFFDFDRDSDADLLVTAHAPLSLSLLRLLEPERRATTLTPRLFRNDSENGFGFVEVTTETGLDRHYGVVEARAHDVDGDGFFDLLFAMGALEAAHLEPSLVLRNREGKGFEEWAYLPSIDEPQRSLGVRVAADDAIELLVAGPAP